MNVPNHIAIILDGNGRWAKAKGMPRSYGHVKGCANLETVCDYMKELGVKYVTVYAFSTENWKRSKDEVDGLMKLFRSYLKKLEETKPVIVTGDMNVAHKEIDLKNPKTNRKNAGFTDEERQKFTELLDAGFIDTFRYFYPDQTGIYSWWSYRFSARAKNAGWRIDYFCVSESLKDRLDDAKILTDIMGSDHCPVELDLK